MNVKYFLDEYKYVIRIGAKHPISNAMAAKVKVALRQKSKRFITV